MKYLKRNTLTWLGLLLLSIATAMLFYTQHYLHIKPCSLCIDQRYAMLFAFCGLLITFLYRYAGYTVALIASVYGLYIAIEQYQLPMVSNQVCSNAYPPSTTFVWGVHTNMIAQSIFTGSGSCASAGQKMLLAIPLVDWSMAFFCVLICIAFLGWGKEAIKY